MDEETKSITLALPGPAIQRSITVEQVRAYLRSQGWEHTFAEGDAEAWDRATLPTQGRRTRHVLWSSPDEAARGSTAAVVLDLAAEAGISPGEMLARIADGPAAEAARLHARDLAALIEGDSRERDAFLALNEAGETLPAGMAWACSHAGAVAAERDGARAVALVRERDAAWLATLVAERARAEDADRQATRLVAEQDAFLVLLSSLGLRTGAHDLCGALKGALALAEERARTAEHEADEKAVKVVVDNAGSPEPGSLAGPYAQGYAVGARAALDAIRVRSGR